MHRYHLLLVFTALLSAAPSAFSHEPQHHNDDDHHDHQHSHLCEGAGFHLFCAEGQGLHIFEAWYGRVAHDTTSCVATSQGSSNETSTNTTTTGPSSYQVPDLAEDCGSSILASKSTWCQSSDKGGCVIRVNDMAPAVEQKKCPDGVPKYLYLEYECSQASGVAGVSVCLLLLSLMFLFL